MENTEQKPVLGQEGVGRRQKKNGYEKITIKAKLDQIG